MGDPMLVADAVQDGGQPLAANTSRFWLVALFCNVPLLSAFFGFSLAQIAKFLLHFANHGRWDVTRLWGSGGMPSSHTAFVTGLSMSGEPIMGSSHCRLATVCTGLLLLIGMHERMLTVVMLSSDTTSIWSHLACCLCNMVWGHA